MLQVSLYPGLPGRSWACLRELCGHDEAAVVGEHLDAGVALLDRLLVETSDATAPPGRASELALSDRDRILGALYRREYGSEVESTASCTSCGEGFDLRFSLDPLLADHMRPDESEIERPDERGFFVVGRARFRLPTSVDLRAVRATKAEDAERALLRRCVPEDFERLDVDALELAMSRVGPVLDIDLDAKCPQCGANSPVRFEIQSYLMRALAQERRFLVPEVHYMATAYGWGLNEILSLRRADRRAYVRLIDRDRAAAREAQA